MASTLMWKISLQNHRHRRLRCVEDAAGRSHATLVQPRGAVFGLCGVPWNLNSSPKDWDPLLSPHLLFSCRESDGLHSDCRRLHFACFNRRMAFSTPLKGGTSTTAI